MEGKKASTSVSDDLKTLANVQKAKDIARLFKTGYGEYAQSDKFLGVSTNEIKTVAKRYYKKINLSQTARLLKSKYHEIRRAGLEILVFKFANEYTEQKQQKIACCYLDNIENVNNWDLVDASASQILGAFIADKDKTLLYDFAASADVWKQRIAIVSTLHFIRNNEFDDTLAIAEMLMDSPYDLVHKAMGWMLREIGKRNHETELRFLDTYAPTMPRTALRYAVEKFDNELREYYMSL